MVQSQKNALDLWTSKPTFSFIVPICATYDLLTTSLKVLRYRTANVTHKIISNLANSFTRKQNKPLEIFFLKKTYTNQVLFIPELYLGKNKINIY